jgi:phosphate transport system protein
MTKHISQQYDHELELARRKLLEMGGLVEDQVRLACEAFVQHDGVLAERVREGDQQINQMEVALDGMVTQIIARRQPTASDLRLLMAVLKAGTDLERIGDESKRIAKMALDLADQPLPGNQYSEIRHLAREVRRILNDSLDAFARSDDVAAQRVIGMDKEIDQEYEGVIRQMMTYMMEDSRTIRRVPNSVWTARALERIGDHAKNIGEYVVYMVKGTDVRHSRKSGADGADGAG